MADAAAQKETSTSQEFIVRAPGPLHKGVDYFLGKFPQGFEEFKRKKSGWQLKRQVEDNHSDRRRPEARKPKVMPLALADKPGHITHTGQPEGGLTGSGVGMGYFLLVKEGPHFTALPVKDWYNFRQTVRNNVMSLEEAEKRMSSRGAGTRLHAGSRLGAAAARAAEEGEALQEGDHDGEDPDSDEERENQRVARLKAAKTEPAEGQAEGQAEDEDMPTAKVHIDKGAGKGDGDWEHEEERADDDLEQGDEEGSDQEAPTTGKKEKPMAGDPDSDADGDGLTEAGQELQHILRKTHLSSGSEDEEVPGSSMRNMDDDDDDDDDVDLDAMASNILPKAKGEVKSAAATRDTRPTVANAQNAPKANVGKRKAASSPAPVAKKVKPTTKVTPKQEARPANSTQPEAASGPPTAQEILHVLTERGPLSIAQLTEYFKPRLLSAPDRLQFKTNVKKVSKLEERPPGSGHKFVVPR